jgi:hypothetical protein
MRRVEGFHCGLVAYKRVNVCRAHTDVIQKNGNINVQLGQQNGAQRESFLKVLDRNLWLPFIQKRTTQPRQDDSFLIPPSDFALISTLFSLLRKK